MAIITVPLAEVKQKVLKFVKANGLNNEDAATFTELVIEQELVGNAFSTLGELAGKHMRLLGSEQAQEEVVVDKNAARLYKGNGRMATLITADHLDEAIANAKQKGIYAFGIFDSTYNEFFDIFCRRIAAQDCIGIIVENGGPQGVVPFGGKSDVTGTNPLAYGIPSNGHPFVFDAATAAHAWGLIRVARERGEQLPQNAYVDKEGNVTTDPKKAVAVLPFGGFKGYAINILVDVLSGCLVRAKSGMDVPLEADPHIGTFILIIDPASFGDLEAFKASTAKLAQDIMAVQPVDPAQPVRIPGFRGAERRERLLEAGVLEIEESDWLKFQNAYEILD